ncbi:MAG TPA: hypothetical protein VFD43_11895 [Planctomycetota bacterium]|nr:hypothetical protein [Planctomycetota bacterium]
MSGASPGQLAAVVLVYATQALAGWLVLSALRPPADGSPWRPWLDPRRWSRALLLGPALIALQMLALNALGLAFGLGPILLPWWILALLAGVARRARSHPPGSSPAPAGVPVPLRSILLLVGLLFGAALVAGLWMPVHTGDAMNQFALNARIFETHGSLAPEALKSLAIAGHVEYPPLVSLNEALLFLAGGPSRALVIKPFFALAFLAWMLLVVETCFALLPAGAAAFLALVALLAPAAALAATDGYADLRLAATVLLLGLAGRGLWLRPGLRRLLLFLLCAVACALTKLEGVAVGIAAAALPVAMTLRGRLRAATSAPVVLALLALVLAWPLYAHLHGLGQIALVHEKWHGAAGRLPRLPEVLGTMLLMAVDVGLTVRHWGLYWLVALALALWSLRDRARRPAVALALLCGAAHLLLYATVLAVTPADLEWHVTTAAPRLLLHVAPWALLAAALSGNASGRKASAFDSFTRGP